MLGPGAVLQGVVRTYSRALIFNAGRDVEYDLKSLSSQIEPILIIMLGVIVLVLALGVFLPMWDLGKAALGK